MATTGHLAVGLAAGRLLAGPGAERRTLVLITLWLTFVSFLPDADVVAFAFGIPYEAPFGHRGASHSLAFAGGLALSAALVWRAKGGPRWWLFGALTFAACASHGLLDAMTDGGRGIALLWPVSNARYFAPWRPIPVGPIGKAVFSVWGARVIGTEVLMFLPLFAYALWPRRRR